MDGTATAPMAVPQGSEAVAAPAPPQATHNAMPPTPPTGDPGLDGFAKIAAERRSRGPAQHIPVPFGNTQLRIHAMMPAGFAFDAAESEVDPVAAKRMLFSAVVEEDQPTLARIMSLPPDNAEGVDGEYMLDFLRQLAVFYAGRPTAG